MNTNIFPISIDYLLNLFNIHDVDKKKEVASVSSFFGEELVSAIFVHYMESNGTKLHTKEQPIEKGSGPSRKKLDYWFYNDYLLYQAEVKNWTIYSYGINIKDYNNGFSNYNKFITSWIKEVKVNKVFKDMQDFDDKNSTNAKPLLCFWFPINKSEDRLAFMEDEYFPEISTRRFDIFSASNYLESIKHQKFIELPLPKLSVTLKMITQLQIGM